MQHNQSDLSEHQQNSKEIYYKVEDRESLV